MPVITSDIALSRNDARVAEEERHAIRQFATRYLKHADNSHYLAIGPGLRRHNLQESQGATLPRITFPVVIIANGLAEQSELLSFLMKMGIGKGEILIHDASLLGTDFLHRFPPELLIIQDNNLGNFTEPVIRRWKAAGIEKIIFLVDKANIRPSRKPQLLWLGQKLGVAVIFTPFNPFILFTLVQIPKQGYYNNLNTHR